MEPLDSTLCGNRLAEDHFQGGSPRCVVNHHCTPTAWPLIAVTQSMVDGGSTMPPDRGPDMMG
jgi:hypothetical protein